MPEIARRPGCTAACAKGPNLTDVKQQTRPATHSFKLVNFETLLRARQSKTVSRERMSQYGCGSKVMDEGEFTGVITRTL